MRKVKDNKKFRNRLRLKDVNWANTWDNIMGGILLHLEETPGKSHLRSDDIWSIFLIKSPRAWLWIKYKEKRREDLTYSFLDWATRWNAVK